MQSKVKVFTILLHMRVNVIFTCRHIAVLTLQPNVVLTARGDKPRVENTLVNDVISCILGLSSATTIHVLTLDRFTPFCCKYKLIHS